MSEFQSCTLPNGLTVLSERIPHSYSISLGFFVKTGSRDEQPFESGVSHFLEHMFFKGTATRDSDAVNRDFDNLGALYNACTDEDSTTFYASFLPEFLDPVMDIWSDMLRPSLRSEDFESERLVILEELATYEDQPPYMADDLSRAAYFNGHPLGNSVLGSEDSLNAMTPEIMRDYFQRHYGPDNIVLSAAGNIDFDKLVSAAERYCGHWEPCNYRRKPIPLVSGHVTENLIEPSAVQQYILDWTDAPAPTEENRLVASAIASLIGNENGSRMYWELGDTGLADSVQFGYTDYFDLAAFTTGLSCSPENTQTCLDIISRIYEDIHKNGFNQREWDLTRKRALARMMVNDEKVFARMFAIAGDWIQLQRYLTLDECLALIADISLDQINSMAMATELEPKVRYSIGPEME